MIDENWEIFHLFLGGKGRRPIVNIDYGKGRKREKDTVFNFAPK